MTAFKTGILWITACSLLLAQFAWAEHRVEHFSHDSVETCALCVQAERGDNQIPVTQVVEAAEVSAVSFTTADYQAPASLNPYSHYHSRASP